MNAKRLSLITLLATSTLFISGCATYHLTTQSLLKQFADTQQEKKVNFIIAPPFMFPGIVNGNSLREIKVLDSKEQEQVITVTNHTGIRITKKDGKRSTFYFDTLLIQDSTITGKKDHFFGMNIKPINLNSIQKIELQK
jgi:PBP1b-binding outer membrane lipoprotein LpoB